MKKKPREWLKPLFQNPLVSKLLAFWRLITSSWRIYLEKPLPEEEVATSREAASIPSFGFFLLLICATILATLGLLSNSAAVIIGAMIVAPLMNPILSMAFAIATGNWTLYKRSWVTVILGALVTIFISSLITSILPINVVRSEILARTSPNLIDLGIAIAAGAAGAFSLTRQSIASSIAGVAIAVALVPPLCVTGIGLGIGGNISGAVGNVIVSNIQVSGSSFLLFLSNFAGITFTACLIFLSQSYGSLNKALQKLFTWALMIALLCGPLTGSLKEFLVYNRIGLEIRNLRLENPELWKNIYLSHIEIDLKGSTAYVRILLNAPQDLLTDEYLTSVDQRLFNSLSPLGVNAMNSRIRIIPVRIRDHTSVLESDR